MLKVFLYIFFLSATGIVAFLIFLNFILTKIFYLPHTDNKLTPDSFSLKYTNRFIATAHHKKVQVWDINPDARGPVLIGVHGWANTASSLLPLVAKLPQERRICLINTRSHGESDDEKYMTLIKYAEDIAALIRDLEENSNPFSGVVLFGHSLGGAAVLWAASRDARVKGVVTIGTFADLETMMRDGFIQDKLPKGFIGSLITYIEFRIGEKMKNISPLNTVKIFGGPVLLVHGTKDKVVDFTDSNKIYKAARRENAAHFVMKGFGHSDLLKEKALAERIGQFLEKNNL